MARAFVWGGCPSDGRSSLRCRVSSDDDAVGKTNHGVDEPGLVFGANEQFLNPQGCHELVRSTTQRAPA